jgi:hypothetical protein
MEWIDSKCQEATQVYLDPINIYMENFFMKGPQYIFSSSMVFQIDQFSCKVDHDGDPITYHYEIYI